MAPIEHTKAIFEQLADTDGADGVHTIIENHDAWVQNAAIQLRITAAMRTQVARTPRSEILTRRIDLQRRRLESLVTRLPLRIANAS